MPSLDQRADSPFVKILYLGDSGSGKTGSLASLAKQYDLRILDLDTGLDPLVAYVKRECPERLSSIQYESYRDKYKASPMGPVLKGPAKAFIDSMRALTKWPQDDSDPGEWGADKILVIDSLTQLGRAAYAWADGMNPGAKDKRQVYFMAQNAIEDVLALLTSDDMKTNVIVITHVHLTERGSGGIKGYASAIGTALGPKIPRYFNTMVLAETSGTGANVSRNIQTMPTALVDLKNPVPFKLDPKLPLGTGLQTIFAKIKEK